MELGAPVILVQFHPEFKDEYRGKKKKNRMRKIDEELSVVNRKMWDVLVDATNTKRLKKQMQDELKRKFESMA